MNNTHKSPYVTGEKQIRFSKPKNNSIQHSLLHSFLLTQIGYYPNAYGQRVEHIRGLNEHTYLYCQSGRGHVILNGEKITLKKHEVICIPSGTPHVYYADAQDPWTFFRIQFTCPPSTFNHYLENGSAYRHDLSADRVYNISKYLNELMEIANVNYSEAYIIISSQLLQIILTYSFICKNANAEDNQNQVLNRCISYMENHYDKEITLEQLSEITGLSISYISTIFKTNLNTSPINYLIHLRIEKACELLRMSNSKVYEIAYSVGYDNALYFSRLFKKHMNVSPKEYRTLEFKHQSVNHEEY